MEFTQENFDKLITENDNYKKALTEERTRRKESDSKVAEIKIQLQGEIDDLKESLEKESKKKNKDNWLIQEKEDKIKELETQLEETKTKASKYDEVLNKSLEEKLWKIPEDRKEFVGKAIADKPYDSQIELLDGFIADYSKPDFKAKPKDGEADPGDTSEYEKAKAAWDRMGMLQHAPKIQPIVE